MSYLLMHVIGEYLAERANLSPLPVIDLTEAPYRNWCGTEVPLLDETDIPQIQSPIDHPKPDCHLNLAGEHQWSHHTPRLRDTHPLPTTQTVNKSQYWLF